MTIELAVLSRVRYRGEDITGARLGSLLALLAQDPHTGCGMARLVESLWPDRQPEHPAKALQVLVSRARARLGADTIAATPTGYRLTLADDQIDATAVPRHAAEAERHARDGEHADALARAEAGIALCGGADGWANEGGDPLARLRFARLGAYRSLLRSRALALSRLGRRTEAVGPLGDVVERTPRDEEALAELLRCEAATLGQATALARYEAYRRALRDELGTDPGAALRAVHADLVRGDVPTVRHGVLHDPNPLLGRAGDVAAVAELLRTSRVTSIVGPGGLGKTRLAHAVGRIAEQRLVHVVALAGVTTDADVAGEVASVLGVAEPRRGPAGPASVVAGIVTVLGTGPALLVLDNCEHVVRGVADLVGALVSLSADLRVLTTSRAPLGISSESVYPLPELDLTTSVELFGQRARAARPGVDLPADTVRALCAALDGLPLAVELAAARVRVMSVGEIARRIDDRFTLLRGGPRDAPQRHHTLHAVIDWSWQLLEPVARAALRALSVFPGGFDAGAAHYLVDHENVPLVLEQLVDQSLLRVVDTGSGARFRMLETVREFSAARRAEAAETEDVTARFLAWARDFGAARPESVFATDLVTFTEDVRTEQDNLVLALRLALDADDFATVAATSAALGGLWIVESNFTRITELAGDTGWALSHYRPEPALVEVTRAALVLCAVSVFLIQGVQPLRLLVTLRRFPPGPPDTPAGALQTVLCAVIEGSGAPSGGPLVTAMADCVASYLAEADDDLDGALRAAERMLAGFSAAGGMWLQAVSHVRIGELYLRVESGETALHHMAVGLAAVEKLRAWASVTRIRWAIVLASLQHGAVDETERVLTEAAGTNDDEATGMPLFDAAVRAEIHLARGDVDAALAGWRRVADGLRDVPGPWAAEAQAVCVVAHARHGQADLVADVAERLPGRLSAMAAGQTARPAESPIGGVLLVGIAVAGVQDRLAARMIALAERLRYMRNFQPTMSAEHIREVAERADRRAYVAAVAEFADLDHAALRAEIVALLAEHERLSGSRPAGTTPVPTGTRPATVPHTTLRR